MARRVNRSARTGRFVTASTARRSPRTTVTQRISGATSGGTTVHRSAVTGRFVTKSTARRHPSTTISQEV